MPRSPENSDLIQAFKDIMLTFLLNSDQKTVKFRDIFEKDAFSYKRTRGTFSMSVHKTSFT